MITLELSEREAVALHHVASMLTEALADSRTPEEACEVSPMQAVAIKIEIGLMLAGASL